MTQDQDQDRQALRERMMRLAARDTEAPRAAVHQDEGEDWPLLTALLCGLALAVMANTFIGLMPV